MAAITAAVTKAPGRAAKGAGNVLEEIAGRAAGVPHGSGDAGDGGHQNFCGTSAK